MRFPFFTSMCLAYTPVIIGNIISPSLISSEQSLSSGYLASSLALHRHYIERASYMYSIQKTKSRDRMEVHLSISMLYFFWAVISMLYRTVKHHRGNVICRVHGAQGKALLTFGKAFVGGLLSWLKPSNVIPQTFPYYSKPSSFTIFPISRDTW